jgi:hypothetical protein
VRGCTAVDVVEDLADEVGIGDICDHGDAIQLPLRGDAPWISMKATSFILRQAPRPSQLPPAVLRPAKNPLLMLKLRKELKPKQLKLVELPFKLMTPL